MIATYADLQNDIADDIDDTTGEYSAAIKKAILGAIRYCERNTYYFNETRDITFSTVNGQEWYDSTANTNIPTLVHIENAWTEDASGQRSILSVSTETEIELLADNSAARGQPYCYAYFGQRIRLYPIPGATAYTVRLEVAPYRLTTLSAPTDTNAWLTEAYDLVKARAKYILAKNTLKDVNVATEAENDFNDQDTALAAETSARDGTGKIRATKF